MTEITLGLAFAALGVLTMAPAVTFGDCGEFAACARVLGVAHAPGYPHYVLLARLLGAAFPFGNWGYRTNLLSAVCAAAALALLCDALRRLGIGRAARVSASALLGLSPLWRYDAGTSEVFALNSLVLCAVFWICARSRQDPWSQRCAAALGLCLGLGAANHQTVVLALIPAAWAALRRPAPGARRAQAALWGALFFAAGLSCYAFLPLRAAAATPLDWGRPDDWARFWRVLLRRDYGSLSLTAAGATGTGAAAAAREVARWAGQSWRGLGPWTVLAAAGAVVWAPLGLGLDAGFSLLWVAAFGPLFLLIGRPPFDAQTASALERFAIAPGIGLCALTAAAFEGLWRAKGPGRAAWAACAAAGLAWCAAGSSGWRLRGDFSAYDYGRNVLRSAPPSAALFIDGGDDTFYSLAFLRYAQGLRPNLDVHDRGALVFHNVYGDDFRLLSPEDREERRRVVESWIAAREPLYYSTLREEILPGRALVAAGLLERAAAGGLVDRPEESRALWRIYPDRFEPALCRAHYRDRAIAAYYPAMKARWLASQGRWKEALEQLRLSRNLGGDALWVGPQTAYLAGLFGSWAAQKRRWEDARLLLEWQAAQAPGDAEARCNLGAVALAQGRSEAALKWYQLALQADPRSSRAYYDLGLLAFRAGQWTRAAERFQRALALGCRQPQLPGLAAEARRRARSSSS